MLKKSRITTLFLGLLLTGCSQNKQDTHSSPHFNLKTQSVMLSNTALESDQGFTDMEIQKDGRMVVIGNQLDRSKIMVARYHSDGQTLDFSFGRDGIQMLDIYDSIWADADEIATGLAIDPKTSKMYVCGYIHIKRPSADTLRMSEAKGFISRLNADGTLDNAFGDSGTVEVSLGKDWGGFLDDEWTTVNQCILEPDGKPIVVGHTVKDDGGAGFIQRYDLNGKLDGGFKNNNTLFTVDMTPDVPEKSETSYIDVSINKKGNIFVLGSYDDVRSGDARVSQGFVAGFDTFGNPIHFKESGKNFVPLYNEKPTDDPIRVVGAARSLYKHHISKNYRYLPNPIGHIALQETGDIGDPKTARTYILVSSHTHFDAKEMAIVKRMDVDGKTLTNHFFNFDSNFRSNPWDFNQFGPDAEIDNVRTQNAPSPLFVDANQKVYLAFGGREKMGSRLLKPHLIRLNSDLSLDTSFGETPLGGDGGTLTPDLPYGFPLKIWATPSGNIAVAGFTTETPDGGGLRLGYMAQARE